MSTPKYPGGFSMHSTALPGTAEALDDFEEERGRLLCGMTWGSRRPRAATDRPEMAAPHSSPLPRAVE